MSPQAPVLLVHGMACGPWVWRDVVAQLPHLDLRTVTLAGHRGGTPIRPEGGPATEQMVDDLERWLDDAGIEQAHVVGNSLGGWVALRLAERGRALSVLCLAPAGGWLPGTHDEKVLMGRFALGRQVARRAERFPALLGRAAVRRGLMRPVTATRAAASLENARALVRDLAHCQALELGFGDPGTRLMSPIGPVDVPATIVWCEQDRVLHGTWAQERYAYLPFRVETLAGAGHLPMLDDPAGVADLIARQVVAQGREATAG